MDQGFLDQTFPAKEIALRAFRNGEPKNEPQKKEGSPLAATGTLPIFGCPNEITLFGDPQPLSSIGAPSWNPLDCEITWCFHHKQ